MDKDEIEYLIHDIIMISEDITLMEFILDNYYYSNQAIFDLAQEQLQLLHVNRDLSIQELMDLGE